jgi:probable rRNA maturation factor
MRLQVRNLQERPADLSLLQRIGEVVLAEERKGLDELSLVFVDDERMREMNLAYRGTDRPTDVLSFEAETDADGSVSGEVIIAVPTAQRQAAEQGHSTDYEIAWLFAHGLLHVLGHDDETQAGLDDMKSRQTRALDTVGLRREPC